MINVNVLYNTTTGRILLAKQGAIAPTPGGFAILAVSLVSMGDVFGKKVDTVGLTLVPKDYLEVVSPTDLDIATVQTIVFQKKNGVSAAAMVGLSDDEPFRVSTREPDYSLNMDVSSTFFDTKSGLLENGAGQVKMATSLAIGQQVLVVWNDTLEPAFTPVNYT